jgi:hypothetical protein
MNSKNPDISISIVNYNSFDYLLKCLRTISKHSQGLNLEILIVDNASMRFDSSSIYDLWADAHITYNKKNMGFAYAQNQNFRLSNGDFFLLLNPDTLITEGCLRAMLDVFHCSQDVAVVSPNLIREDGKTMVTVNKMPTIKSAFFELLCINALSSFFRKKGDDLGYICNERTNEVDCVDGAAFMVRSSVYDMLNGLDERFFMYFEEVDFCKRARDIGLKMCFLPGVRIYHLYGKSTIGTDVRQTVYFQSYYKYFKKHHGTLRAIAIRVFIFLGEVIHLLAIQVKYFPLYKGLSTYLKKVMTSLKLIFWTLGIRSCLGIRK